VTAALTWNAPDGDHPARRASQRSAVTVARGVKEDWLDLFAPDGVVEDPVGPSMFDPEGRGHRGRDAIGRFWDLAIAHVQEFRFTIEDSFANGDSCANVARSPRSSRTAAGCASTRCSSTASTSAA
jgi:steroid Delta-isomerase